MRGTQGERSHTAKLTETNVIYIRRKYDDGSRTIADLALELQRSYSAVHMAATRRTWRHVPETPREGDNVSEFNAWWERRTQQALMSERGHLIRSRAVMLRAWEAARA